MTFGPPFVRRTEGSAASPAPTGPPTSFTSVPTVPSPPVMPAGLTAGGPAPDGGASLGVAHGAPAPAGGSTRQGAPRDRRPIVLVVDDEESYRQALASGLAQEGFVVELAADGHEALRLFHRVHPDLVLLDVMLPDQSGVELCQRMRAAAPVPIIMVTARDSEVDVVVGLEVGAADYVAKPFRLRELVARMRAVLRRGSPTPVPQDEVLVQGPVKLDAARREVTVEGRSVDLSRKEFDLLALLMAQPGQVVTRDWCIDRLWWDQELADTRTLDTHVKRLRRKIEPDPAHPRHLVTVRGVGFRFEP
jgi:two-component system, OmpR family, response regulator RegX3